MSVARRRRNPTRARRVTGALGLGISVTSLGLALAEIYRRPAIAYGGTVLGVLLAAVHWPRNDHVHTA